MKRILKQVELLRRFYWRYRIIITEEHIEIRLTPKSHLLKEDDWVFENDKQGKIDAYYSLSNHLKKLLNK